MSKPSFGFNIVNHALIRKVRSKHRLRFNGTPVRIKPGTAMLL